MFASRLPAIKFLGIIGGLNVLSTYVSKNTGKNVMTIQQYIDSNIDERTQYTIMGIIKPRSIQLASGLGKKFKITDSIQELNCKFDGITTMEIKEGQTAVVTGYCPDLNKKKNIIVKEYVTKHSMETNDWKTKNNVSSNSYGLEKYK